MEMTKEDAYEVLDLSPGAPIEDVVRQYKLAALEWYPDKHKRNSTSIKKFQLISQSLLTFCLSDLPYRRNLLTLEEMLSLFQFIFFGNDNLGDDDDDDSTDSSEEEDSFEEFYNDWKFDPDDVVNEMCKNLTAEEDDNSQKGSIHKEIIVQNTASKIDVAVQNAKELIEEEEREKKKAKKRRAQKKKRKEKKKLEKNVQKQEDEPEKQENDEEPEENEDQNIKESSSEFEEEIDPDSAFVAIIAKKKNKNIPQKKKNEKTKTTPEKETNVEENASRILRSRQLALRGNEMANLGHYQEAVQLFSEAIRLDSSDYRFYGNRSYCYDRLGNYDRSLNDAEKSISLDPKVPKGYFRKGRALAGLKRYAEAEKCFQEVLKLDPQCEDAEKELILVKVTHIMDMGFSEDQAKNAIHQYGTVDDALQYLLPAAAAALSLRKDEDIFLSDDEDEFLARCSKVQTHQAVDVKMDPCNPEGHNSIWVGNLQAGVTENIVKSLFAKYGEILSIKFTPEKFYAFVNYKNKLSAGKAMRALQGMELFGANLLIRYPNTKPAATAKPSVGLPDPSKVKVFVVPVNGDECYFWRTLGCIHGNNCRFKHIKEHKGIDKK